MKVKVLAVFFLVFLTGVGLSEAASEPVSEPETQSVAQVPRAEMDSELRKMDSELRKVEAEVRAVDPQGRLTSEQLFQLLVEREKRRSNDAQFDPTPAIITIFLCSSLLTGFLAWLYASFRKERQRHETVRLMVEKGAEVPSGLLAPAPKKPSDLRRGLILSTAGLGLTIFLAALPGARGVWGAGVTLFLLGVGHLLVWRLQGGRGSWSSALVSEPQP